MQEVYTIVLLIAIVLYNWTNWIDALLW